MKTRKYVKYIVLIGITLLFLLAFFSQNISEKQAVVKPQLNRETEVYVDIEREKSQPAKSMTLVSKSKVYKKTSIKEKKIDKKITDVGELPPISANYRKYVGFRRYSEEMSKLGCRFFIFSESSNKIFEINLHSKKLDKCEFKSLINGKYSQKSRVISDEPALDKYYQIASEKYSLVNPEVVMLVPKILENKIAASIRKNGVELQNVFSLNGYYKITSNHMVLCIDKAVLNDSSRVGLNIVINL